MPTNENIPVAPLPPAKAAAPTTHDLHIKSVPQDVWLHARHNALLSNLSFKDYVIRTLAASHPLTGDHSHAQPIPEGL